MKRTSGRSAATATAAKAPARREASIADDALDAFFALANNDQIVQAAAPILTGEAGGAAAAISIAEREALDLFPDDKPPPPVKLRWRGCAVCGAKDTLPAHPAHDVCQRCTAEPDEARRRLEIQRRTLINAQRDAAARADAAWRALTEDEQARWGAYATLRETERARLPMSDDDARRLAATAAAYANPDHPRISPALRRYAQEDECLFWANEANKAGQAKVNAQLAQLALCLEEMGR